ncbi:S-layer homology domain-containing protein [Candidatus Peregrinibacteria bacterium]|nr:S-layer homology domain-containing protein [Candidatus Peregrinibacteria bacterium]
MKKIILAIAIFIIGGVSSLLIANAVGYHVEFNDVDQNAYYASPLYGLANEGIIKGYPDNTFKPGNFVNRAEYVTGLYKVFSAQNEMSSHLKSIICSGFKQSDFTANSTGQKSFIKLCLEPTLE